MSDLRSTVAKARHVASGTTEGGLALSPVSERAAGTPSGRASGRAKPARQEREVVKRAPGTALPFRKPQIVERVDVQRQPGSLGAGAWPQRGGVAVPAFRPEAEGESRLGTDRHRVRAETMPVGCDGAGQGSKGRVQVRGDGQSQMMQIVSRVGDRGDGLRGDDPRQAKHQLGASDAAGEHEGAPCATHRNRSSPTGRTSAEAGHGAA